EVVGELSALAEQLPRHRVHAAALELDIDPDAAPAAEVGAVAAPRRGGRRRRGLLVAAHRAISSSSAGCAANSLPSSASTASRGDLPATSTISAFFARGGGANTFLTTVGEPLRPQRATSGIPAALWSHSITS